MDTTTIARRARRAAAVTLAAVGLCCAAISVAGFGGADIPTPGGVVSAAAERAGADSGATRRDAPEDIDPRWAAAPGITRQTGAEPADPSAVDTTLAEDPGALEAYVDVLTRSNTGKFFGASRWGGPVTYRISLPGHYPVGVADEVRTAYRWMSEVTGITITEVTEGTADIAVVGYGNNGGLTRFNAVGGQLGDVTVSIGCCRRRPVWEEALHSMGLYADAGPTGSLVADYGRRHVPVEVPTAADATVLRALYSDTLTPGAGRDEVRAAIIAAARS